MNKKFIITILIWTIFHQVIQAGDNLLWIGYTKFNLIILEMAITQSNLTESALVILVKFQSSS